MKAARFLPLGPLAFYTGKWGDCPVWSMTTKRVHVRMWWRLFRRRDVDNRETMKALLAAQIKAKQ